MGITINVGTGFGSQWNSGGGGGKLQQIWLPRSVLKADQTNFYKIEDYTSVPVSNAAYACSFVDGNLIYIQNGATFNVYNMATRSWETTISGLSGWGPDQRIYYIRVGRKVYMMRSVSSVFGYFDLDLKKYISLSFPSNFTFSLSSPNNLIGLAMRYDSLYNKIYAIIPYRYMSNNINYNGSVACYVYDIASNTWQHISNHTLSAGAYTAGQVQYLGKGCLIDFSDTKVKFLNNGANAAYSLTIDRTDTPTMGSNAWQTETTFTYLPGSTTIDASAMCSIIQTDDKVFGIKGNKVFRFNLFTGEVSEDSLFGAVPVMTILGSSSNLSAAASYGVSYDNGKLYFATHNQVWAMDYIQSIQPGGPLAFKIYTGQKYSSFKPIVIKKADGTEYLIDQTVRKAEQDIEIRVGEYDNTQEMSYLLIEN